MYSIEVFDPESGEFVVIHETEYAVRVRSDQYVPKVIFETDDPEHNG